MRGRVKQTSAFPPPSLAPSHAVSLSLSPFFLLYHFLCWCMIYHSVACGKGSRCHGNPKPGLEWEGVVGAHTSTKGDLMHRSTRVCAHTHTHMHVATDQDYERDSVQGPAYKVMESRAGDIRGRAALTGVNKISVGAGSWLHKRSSNHKQIYHNSSLSVTAQVAYTWVRISGGSRHDNLHVLMSLRFLWLIKFPPRNINHTFAEIRDGNFKMRRCRGRI